MHNALRLVKLLLDFNISFLSRLSSFNTLLLIYRYRTSFHSQDLARQIGGPQFFSYEVSCCGPVFSDQLRPVVGNGIFWVKTKSLKTSGWVFSWWEERVGVTWKFEALLHRLIGSFLRDVTKLSSEWKSHSQVFSVHCRQVSSSSPPILILQSWNLKVNCF